MKRVITIALVLALAGCSNDPDGFSHDNHGYGWEYGAQGVSGLRLRYAPTVHPTSPLADPALYERIFEEVNKCSQLQAPPPFVILADHLTEPNGNLVSGLYYTLPSLILLGNTAISARHEMIHHLLYHSTGDVDYAHTSPWFALCGDPRL